MILLPTPTEYIQVIKILVDAILVLYVDAYTGIDRAKTYERTDAHELECETFADEAGLYPIMQDSTPLFIRGWIDTPF